MGFLHNQQINMNIATTSVYKSKQSKEVNRQQQSAVLKSG